MRNRVKWSVHIEECRKDSKYEEGSRYTITLDAKTPGWRTDSGYEGYGLPKPLAQWICDRLNESDVECPYKMNTWEGFKKREK